MTATMLQLCKPLHRALSRRSLSAHFAKGSSRAILNPDSDEDETESSSTSFSVNAEEIARVYGNRKVKAMTLRNFIEESNPQDPDLLKKVLEVSRRKWKCVKFEDTIHGSNYRRWVYKKVAICRRFFPVAMARGVPMIFDTTVQVSDMPPQAILSVLEAMGKDVDVTALEISVTLECHDALQVLHALMTLLVHDKRRWNKIDFHVVLDGVDDSDESHESQRSVAKYIWSLEQICKARNIPVTSCAELEFEE